MIKIIAGILSGLAGVVLAAYVGIYLCLYKGIIQVVHAASINPVDGKGVAVGLIKIVFATTIAEVIAGICFMIAFGLFGWSLSKKGAFENRKIIKPRR